MLRVVVALFQWLQTQDIAIRARNISGGLNVIADHPILAEPAHNNRVEFPPLNSEPDLLDVGNSNSGQHASSPVFVSNLGASNTAIDALSQDWQGKLMFMFPPFPPFPLLSKVIQKLRTTQVLLWTTLSSFHTAGTYCHNRDMSRMASRTVCVLGGSHAALPSSRIFEQVSRHTAAPRRPSTNIVTTGGFTSLTGLQDKDLICLVPQLLK